MSMSAMMPILLATLLVCSVCATSEASSSLLASKAAVKAMEGVFARSEKAHAQSMAAIMQSMTPQKAWQVLEKSNLTSPALIEMTRHVRAGKSHLRQTAAPKGAAPKGYAGVGKARDLLNTMIYEAMYKYDTDINRCTESYATHCAAMEASRGQIAASNYVAANARSLILDAQGTINRCEESIPETEGRLTQHLKACKHEREKMKTREKIMDEDIKVLTTILKMTECKKEFVQMDAMSLLRCEDPCTKKSFITFNQSSLKEKVSQLQSSVSHGLMEDTFKDLFEGAESTDSVDFLQLDAQQGPVINVTKYKNDPLPRTEVPGNPCTDPDAGAPSARHKRAAKCTITKSPQCPILQERFLLIQSGIKDEREQLLDEMEASKRSCDEQETIFRTEIDNDMAQKNEAETKLAEATTKEATAAETARQTARDHSATNDELKKEMEACSKGYIQSETELCALKKIRGELYKMKGSQHSAFFQDCVVSKWTAEECSKKCAGGTQKLSREVSIHANGGAKCLPLEELKKCNENACPVDCKLSTWSGWSKCSAECGSGVQQRLREVKRPMKHDGKPCSETSETRACNNQACEKDCELSEWSAWSACSKDCDGGTRKRWKYVKSQPTGAGKCAGKWSRKRLEFKKCNTGDCLGPLSGACSTYAKDAGVYTCESAPTCCNGHQPMGMTAATVQCVPASWSQDKAYKIQCPGKPMACKKELDVVLLLDGSGSLGQTGWKAEIKAAQTFVDAFSGSGAKAAMSVILYSGPRTWGGVYKCTGKNTKTVDVEKTCKIKSVTHFTSDMKAVKAKIAGLTWPKGSTLTSLALLSAQTELSLGRSDAKSVVVAITDGRPLSYRRTYLASRNLRKSARLIWVPVTKFAPLRRIKLWATRRWQENVVRVKTFKDLENVETVNHIIADICPLQ